MVKKNTDNYHSSPGENFNLFSGELFAKGNFRTPKANTRAAKEAEFLNPKFQTLRPEPK